MAWEKLIRFESAGVVYFGEPVVDSVDDLLRLSRSAGLWAKVYEGTSFWNLSMWPTTSKPVDKILPLLEPCDVPLVKCIGLNYIKHIKEGGRTPPPYPSVFIKPSASIAAYEEVIPIPKIAQNDQLDYEGELSIVIGKTGKDIPEAEALQYVAGYVASNDVSARKWQRDPAYAGNVPQWCFSKGFDKFCALGPVLVSPTVVGAADTLELRTWVNGELRQSSSTSDLLFGVKQIIAFLSQGTTLEQGTVIMTGTPAGVAMGMPEPKYLQDGDVVEVEISQLGRCSNRMKFS